MKMTIKPSKNKHPSREGAWMAAEIYTAPPPPPKGRIIGLDCHPDTYTAAVFRGSTPHDARKLACGEDMSLQSLLDWVAGEFTPDDLFLMEAGSNSFEVHRRLLALGLRAVVLESCHVGKHSKTYADNDRMGQWGWKLFARKGERNIAVAAVARKLAVQAWHLLCGNPPTALEADKSTLLKFQRLAVTLGKKLRAQLGLPTNLPHCIRELQNRMLHTSLTGERCQEPG